MNCCDIRILFRKENITAKKKKKVCKKVDFKNSTARIPLVLRILHFLFFCNLKSSGSALVNLNAYLKH